MNSKNRIIAPFNILLMIMTATIISCDVYIIQRGASDYFQYEPGNWWHLVGNADTLFVEVEALDTIGNTEIIPVSFNGYARFVYEGDEALYEHVSIVYVFSGSEYPVIDDFVERVELPLVNGNSWRDSLVGSIEVSGQQITGQYDVWGMIIDSRYSSEHDGDLYTIEITTRTQLVTPDTVITDSLRVLEEYAPGIGIVRFQDQTDEYLLTDYLVQ